MLLLRKKRILNREEKLSLEEPEAYELEEKRLFLYFLHYSSFATVFLLVRAGKKLFTTVFS